MKNPPCFHNPESKKEIRRLCAEHKIDEILLKDLCEILLGHAGSGRKDGIHYEITDCIDRFIDRN